MWELNVHLNGAQYVIAPILYTSSFIGVLFFFCHKCNRQSVTFPYVVITLSYLIQTLSFSTSHVIQLYSSTTCVSYFLSRVVYICNFFIVSYTLFHWVKGFTEREVRVINLTVVGMGVLILNILFISLVIASFIALFIEGNDCVSNNGNIEAWNTWISTGSNMLLAIIVLAFGILIIQRYHHQISHFTSPDSKKSFLIYIFALILLIIENLLRFIVHLYFPITKKYMNDILFQTMIHWLPDMVETVTILVLWSSDEMSWQFNKEFEERMFANTKIILRNIRMEYSDLSVSSCTSYQHSTLSYRDSTSSTTVSLL
ncbi:hypothetical protein EDI_196280 [Entamoeba dispar SAW760]|uniref:THH1/TOM1/TOM3 domain-containing protein n=1 Tax=Entamoeba dispar (strain ATCC PRA-260 / SAW760) TaxID=370354 RepID=B0EL22_ENTDS|nr:uncharacterized protein EDI_196280 [Entamoeba dispar SAW760]EDR24784.1 hypothetical protein EDI_196280 [Entamoeba dispar SAW760]|eukprot:EDR24784.1 hypothetical protein EDI_196280 [Entamoeba dispar SAW760]